MTELLLIRHGETAWNAERRLQGHTDIALNAAGLRQADALGRALAAEKLDAIYASDLARASQTAQAVAAHHGLPVQTRAALRERCYGGFEGLRYLEIEQRYPQQYAAWQARDVDASLPPGEREGESFRQFYERSLAALRAIALQHAGQRIAIVAHGGVLECAYRAAHGLPLDVARNFPVLNASVNRIAVDSGLLRVLQWGDVAHLSASAMDEVA
ncbi:MAG TPA: histidine phosphatase family protein [Burkholderiaceae bacterium]